MENLNKQHPVIKGKMQNSEDCTVKRGLFTMILVFVVILKSGAVNMNAYFTPAEIKKANTARSATYLSETEREVYKVLNLARLYPQKFLKFYLQYAKEEAGMYALKNNTYYISLSKELKNRKAVNALSPDGKLWEMAKCWAKEAGKSGVTGHNRSECKGGYRAECCTYGEETAVDIVMSFLIDDGVESLGHREICLSPDYNYVGVSKHDHKVWRSNTVLDFNYRSKPVVKK